MKTGAVNVIEVLAVSGQSQDLRAPIDRLLQTLGEVPGCLSYQAVRSLADADLWIITGYWESTAAMRAHFAHPALNDLERLLDCRAVKRVAASSFTASQV
ncbi:MULTISPECIES: antibiotic biosynthesis monooxygenase family protein [Pseudomonas]|jgi:quinol monooxygenase YgiN|uniref:ABM domain-containing protein n=1 Tax=Pseudomonas fluorescens R124 TaxID=743713 RepID=A0A7U9CUJ4_PSEFL|nr:MULTISPECIES: antibiotic biosynthesis monooxygenase family protein [Pseudomonas]EJZ58822.1 hypothetical protein I1A_003153 [Pseudomonas fluorescens R124]MCU1775041.1 antibiotic biosynthesis monooxygenase [Pseudomonas sp. 13B_3.2_Bac1]RBC01455.1 antibiotic biosynthesis monooxygenase [Pseudomonas sp. MWU12-2115]